ncbi:MAG: carboxypeptidase regulatory-like domain-containing protein, partial [Acidobacteriaceae bacterium]|nr:carboxypeptidase regulatory-like domain-containing protein [Acidobacteriaceae bacterium]
MTVGFSLASSLLLTGLLVTHAWSQEVNGQIHGTVTDPTGAAVPDARVTATNTQTQVSASVPTKTDGSFEFLQLPVGTYNVTVGKTGFRTFTAENIALALNQIYNLPVSLQVGQVSESVVVEANAVQVETSTTQLSTVIQGQQIVDLPLNGMNWIQLQQLAPCVVSTSDRFTSNYATNGSQSQQNSFLVNGADAIDLPLNTPLIIPSPDAIAEFNLITSTLNPEYGRNSGAVLNAVIKSGTNRWTGDVFDFYRDTFLNGRNIYQVSKQVFHQNQFGGTLGGPVWRDHTFFFLSYQGTRNRSPQTGGQVTVPTQAQRNGLFPDIARSTAKSPFPLVGSNGQTYPAGTPYSTIFGSGQIPTADFNAISQNLLSKYVPQANIGTNLYSF